MYITTMYQNDWKPGTTFIEEGRLVVLLVLAVNAAEVVCVGVNWQCLLP